MNYTKPMIELVYEIRRLVPSDLKPGIKLANPELFEELLAFYHSGAKTVTKALIRELFLLAGQESRLLSNTEDPEKASSTAKGALTKMYRGVVSLEEKTQKADKAMDEKPIGKPKRVYRGQVVA